MNQNEKTNQKIKPQWLPFEICYTGQAPISSFFNLDNNGISAFRGREVKSQEVKLPPNTNGFIFEKLDKNTKTKSNTGIIYDLRKKNTNVNDNEKETKKNKVKKNEKEIKEEEEEEEEEDDDEDYESDKTTSTKGLPLDNPQFFDPQSTEKWIISDQFDSYLKWEHEEDVEEEGLELLKNRWPDWLEFSEIVHQTEDIN